MSIAGTWHPAFAGVADEFAALVTTAGERGALCVMREGEVLIDIRGGEAAPGQPWAEDTLACCFSVTKGVLGLLAHVMIARGMIALRTSIGTLWPEFSQPGLTLDDILGHRARLPAVTGVVASGDLYDRARMAALLARSGPVVPEGEPVYHNMTWGHLLAEVLCRAAGVRPLSRLLAQLVTGPLGADFHLGLDPAAQARCATISQEDPRSLFRALAESPDSLFARSMAFFDPEEDFNSARWRAAEIGSGSGHATAVAIARIFGQFVWRDALLSPAQQALAREETGRNPADPVMGIPIRYGRGIELNWPPALDFGPSGRAVGHWGAGGAQGFADPEHGISAGYVTGHMASAMGSSARGRRLVAAIFAALEAQ